MEFFPNEPLDDNRGQNVVWEAVKEAFREEEGAAFYRYPIYGPEGLQRSEPDILIILRRCGVFVIECKGMSIDHVAEINGHVWRMLDWFRETELPVSQARRYVFVVKQALQEGGLKQLPWIHDRVALPFIMRQDWTDRGYSGFSATRIVALAEDLCPEALRRWAEQAAARAPMPELDDASWEALSRVFGRVGLAQEPAAVAPAASAGKLIRIEYEHEPPSDDLLRSSHALRQALALDEGEQPSFTPDRQRIAFRRRTRPSNLRTSH
jgi:hypothetical protein